MKISHIYLENFKRFETLDIPIKNKLTTDIADTFLILGDNGTGKTSLLQAIALTLSLASYITKDIHHFNWTGWLPGRYAHWGFPKIRLTVNFSDLEIETTQKAAEQWHKYHLIDNPSAKLVLPTEKKEIILEWEGFRFNNPKAEIYQFQGRSYASRILSQFGDQEARELFKSLPGVFWFDQFRNLFNFKTPMLEDDNADFGGRVKLQGIAELRNFLNKWYIGRQIYNSDENKDYLLKLENIYKKIFPGRQFSQPEVMHNNRGTPTPDDYYFMLTDGQRTYDIEEMSAGEQSIFPILYEFVRQQIHYSIILIDEVDLNLHPPLAQKLFNFLPQLGENCQFIYTTHADTIAQLASPEEIYRLQGGQLCL